MHRRVNWALMLATLASAMLASMMLVGRHDSAQGPSSKSELPEIAPAPEFSLTSQDGGQVTLADFRGRRVVVFFFPKADTPG